MPLLDTRGQSAMSLLRQRSLADLARETLYQQVLESMADLSEELDDEDVETIAGWLVRYSRSPKDPDRPFAFRGIDGDGFYFNYEFQRAILDDPAKKVVVRKSAQMGISEIMARDCLARLNRHQGTQALYVLPTKEDVMTFSDTRIRMILENSPALRRVTRDLDEGKGQRKVRNKDTDNAQRKQIGNSFLIVRGGWEYRNAQMVPADFLYLDEYERLKENVVPSFENRLSASRFKIQRSYSTPYIEGKGIDALFQETDQKYWFDLCWHCGHAQIMGEEQIRQAEREDHYLYWYACRECGKELTPEKRRGEWRPTRKSVTNVSGYQISQFMSPTMTAEEMVQKKAGGSLFIQQDYLNLTLGLPAKGGMQDEEVRYGEIGDHSATLHLLTSEPIVMAIDWGGTGGSYAEISVPIDERHRKVIWVECFKSDLMADHIERMKWLAMQSRATHIVADMGWGQYPNEAMREHFGNDYWTIMTNSEALFEPTYQEKKHHIIWGKLRCFKSHLGALRQRLIYLPRESPMVPMANRENKPAHEVWQDHHKNVIIRVIDDEKRIDVAQGASAAKEEVTSKGPMHLAAVSAYADVMWHWVRRNQTFDVKKEARRGKFRVGHSRSFRK